MEQKIATMAEAVSLVRDGSSLAIGGHTLRRHPMAFVAEVVRQEKKGLHLQGWNSGIDFDLLIGAGCVDVVETSYVGMGPFGLAQNYRRAAESGSIRVIEHTETTAIDMFRAIAMGLGFLPTKTPLGTDLMRHNERLTEMRSPFDGELYAAVRGANPDVAVIHAHTADVYGNVQLDPARWMDNSVDVLMAKAAKKVVVTVEQIVSSEEILRNPLNTILPRIFVSAVVEAPFGAHPCCCDARYSYDLSYLEEYYEASKEQATFDKFLDRYARGVSDHFEYLERVGIEPLLAAAVGRQAGGGF